MAKTYYFICSDCNQRKPKEEECFFHPGVCKSCYETLDKYAPDERDVLKPT